MLDHLIKYEWGKATSDKLIEQGVNGEFHTYANLGHGLSEQELIDLREWILKLLPPIQRSQDEQGPH
jgi:predicted esterase